MNKVCVCFGGGNISVDFELCEKLNGAILQSIEEGFKTFFCGGYGNFSILFAAILRNCQQRGKDIRVACYIPDLPNSNQYRTELLGLNLYDDVYILPGKNLIETDLFLIKKGQRIIVSKSYEIKNNLLLQEIIRFKKELFFI